MRASDSHEISQLNELKAEVANMAFVAHYALAGDIIMDEQMPIFGGFAGGLEETTIVDVATHLSAFTLNQATWHLDGPVHMRWGCTTAREPLAVAAHGNRAIEEKHPTLMTGNQYYPVAGPCTVMCLLETAAQAITDTCSGREIMSGVAAAKGVKVDKTTGLEARFMGEVSHAVAGMALDQVNEILDTLVAKYEKDFKTADEGKTFAECYDTDKIVPTDEYLAVYDEAVAVMKDLGVCYKTW